MSAEMEKKKVAEKVWLDYFNEYLFEHGLIDKTTRNKLRIKIITMEKKSNTYIGTVGITRDGQVVFMGTALLR